MQQLMIKFVYVLYQSLARSISQG